MRKHKSDRKMIRSRNETRNQKPKGRHGPQTQNFALHDQIHVQDVQDHKLLKIKKFSHHILEIPNVDASHQHIKWSYWKCQYLDLLFSVNVYLNITWHIHVFKPGLSVDYYHENCWLLVSLLWETLRVWPDSCHCFKTFGKHHQNSL